MSYTVLARRYRSQGFDEVIGQEAIARTLKNAIDSGRVAHAYLFCGTRGVGKTSMARIFAKALNGGTPDIDAQIMAGKDTDVIEIDGASNNKVEDAHTLMENAAYRPLRGKYKIFIIDEVHMLSTAAFNALLKTMEEPPEYVKFILCTTDPQKVLPTIQSRCQRFDFRNIPTPTIAEHLKAVVKKEGIAAEPDLLFQVAKLGAGSMRDALSLLDRVIASGEKILTSKLLEELLGLPPNDLIASLIDALASGDAKTGLERTDELLAGGISPDQLLETLVEKLRDLMILAACGPTTHLVELAAATREQEIARAARFDAAGLVHMIALCESVLRSTKNSSNPRALLDAVVVRLALTEKLADVTAIITGRGGGGVAGLPVGSAPAKKS